MAFSLSQLTDIYMQELMPYLTRSGDGVLVRLDTHYIQVMAKIGIGVDALGRPLEPSDRQKSLHKELFGERVVDVAPPRWYEAEAMLAAEKMPHEWVEIPIKSRAEWMAAQRIQGMTKTLERYREVMDRRLEKTLGKQNKPRMNRKKR